MFVEQVARWLGGAVIAAVVIVGPGCVVSRGGDGSPNILVAIADDWSHGHAGVYGCGWVSTPAFDRVAREGVLFQRAYTPNAKCAPSRASLLTGRNSWQLKEAANHVPFFPPEFKGYVEALKDQGYTVGFTGKGWGPGVAHDAHGQPRALTGQAYQNRKLQPTTTGISRIDYAANFEDFLNDAGGEGPWCFWYGALEPHRAFEYGSGAQKGGKSTSAIERVPRYWPDNEAVRNDLLDYAFEVEHFDRHLGRILALLESRGLLESTLVVVTSDHGMAFPRVKGQAYDDSNRVPLAVRWGNRVASPGRVIDDYVSLIDLAPTFLEVAGVHVDQSGMAPITGRSLLPLLASSKRGQIDPSRDHVLIGKERHDVGRPRDGGYPIRGIIKANRLYLRNFEPDRWPSGNPETGYLNCDGGTTKSVILKRRRRSGRDEFWDLCFGKRVAEEMYDLRQDPDCVINLAGHPAHREEMQALRLQMLAWLRAEGDPRIVGMGAVFDAYPYADEARQGFYEKYMRGDPVQAGWVNPTDFEEGPIE